MSADIKPNKPIISRRNFLKMGALAWAAGVSAACAGAGASTEPVATEKFDPFRYNLRLLIKQKDYTNFAIGAAAQSLPNVDFWRDFQISDDQKDVRTALAKQVRDWNYAVVLPLSLETGNKEQKIIATERAVQTTSDLMLDSEFGPFVIVAGYFRDVSGQAIETRTGIVSDLYPNASGETKNSPMLTEFRLDEAGRYRPLITVNADKVANPDNPPTYLYMAVGMVHEVLGHTTLDNSIVNKWTELTNQPLPLELISVIKTAGYSQNWAYWVDSSTLDALQRINPNLVRNISSNRLKLSEDWRRLKENGVYWWDEDWARVLLENR